MFQKQGCDWYKHKHTSGVLQLAQTSSLATYKPAVKNHLTCQLADTIFAASSGVPWGLMKVLSSGLFLPTFSPANLTGNRKQEATDTEE